MYVTLCARTPCITCGYLHPVYRFSDVRVNKNSLRETGTPLVMAGFRSCPECGTANYSGLMPVSRYRLAPEDAAKVDAYRQRRWPVLAGAR